MNTQVKVALIAAIGSIAVTIVTGMLNAPSPGKPFPLLHSSYSGRLTRSDGSIFGLAMIGLTEDRANGNFTATGGDGPCAGNIIGSIAKDGNINFTLSQYNRGGVD